MGSRGLVIAVGLIWAGRCWAQPAPGDGVYGRFSGDLSLSAGVAAATAVKNGQILAVDLRARYLDSVGLAVLPEWRLGEHQGAASAALDIRPLFLARFFTNKCWGRSWLDLTMDSLGVDIGSWLGPWNGEFGAALLVGGGIDMPFGEKGDRGFWLRLAGRYIVASGGDKAAPGGGRSELVLMATLLYKTTVDIGLASWEPARYTLL